nr:Chain E, Alpha1a peptide [Pseudomonas fluorescens]6U3M_F Chain F, Alpha1a peptide [Pseudomonas fluorescens]
AQPMPMPELPYPGSGGSIEGR